MRPNILWIGVDQMRADTLGCNGNPVCQTPNLGRLADQGVNFSRAYTPCSLCSPARASMLTGLYAFHHGMGTNCDMYHSMAPELPRPEQLLHRRLKDLGYRLGYTGKWHVGTDLGPLDYGFEGMNLPGYGDLKQDPGYRRYLRDNDLSYGPPAKPIFGNPGQKTLLGARWNGPQESTPTYYLANYAINQLEEYAVGDQPFFLTCQFWAPHTPYLPSPEFSGLHDREAIQPWINFQDDYAGKPESIRRFRSDFYRSLPEDWPVWQELVGLYYDYTALVDAQIGRIMDRLEQLGLNEDTLVTFTSDHGDMTGSHGGLFDKGFMYEEAHRVPLILCWPGHLPAGETNDALVSNMDIFPTILDILGQPDASLDGQSLLPLVENGAPGRAAIYLEFHGIRYLYSQRALVTRDSLKYIFTPGDQDEVYDLNSDPGELHNLIDDPAWQDRVERLRWQLVRAATQANDPIRDYTSKLFSRWEDLSGQPDASSPDQFQHLPGVAISEHRAASQAIAGPVVSLRPADSPIAAGLRERHMAFRQRQLTDRPLIGLHRESMFPQGPFIERLGIDGQVRPDDIDLNIWLACYEDFWQRTGLAWGDMLHFAHPLKLPWMEAIAGCPVHLSRQSGSAWAEQHPIFHLGRDDVSLDRRNPWFQLLLEATEALVDLAAGRFPVCSGAVRGVSDMMAAMLGLNRFYLAIHDAPEALAELAQQLADLWIEVVRALYEVIPPFAEGFVNYGLWTPGISPVYQEDAAGLISSSDFERVFGEPTRRVLSAFPYPLIHLHSAGLQPLPSVLKTHPAPLIEVHIDDGGPPVEALVTRLRHVQEVAPLLIFGDRDPVMACLEQLSPRGLAGLILKPD